MHILAKYTWLPKILWQPLEKTTSEVFPDQGLFIGDQPKYGIQISRGLHNIKSQLSLPKLQPLLLNWCICCNGLWLSCCYCLFWCVWPLWWKSNHYLPLVQPLLMRSGWCLHGGAISCCFFPPQVCILHLWCQVQPAYYVQSVSFPSSVRDDLEWCTGDPQNTPPQDFQSTLPDPYFTQA